MASVLSRSCPLLLLAALACACDAPPPASERGPAQKTASEVASAAAEEADEPQPKRAPEADEREPHPTAPHFSGRSDVVETTVSGEGEGPYRFTAWWHKKRAATWARVMAPYKGLERLNYLEVGVFEGRSLIWMLENVLTRPSATATAIDPFMADYEESFDANVLASGAGERVTKIKALSEDGLRELPRDSFDIIYIDGSHTADDVLVDAILAWDLLRVGGLIIFDDYNWAGRPHGGSLPPELVPHAAVDAFVMAHRYEIELVERGAQVMLRKLENPCRPKDYCSPVGQYLYFWRDFELRDQAGEVVALSPEEIKLVEKLAFARRKGEVAIRPGKKLREREDYLALKEKLALDLRPAKAPPLRPRERELESPTQRP